MTFELPPIRRRSPMYVRQWSSRALHAVLGRFDRMRRVEDLTEAQEWLYDGMVSELQYRRRHARPVWTACSCWYCVDYSLSESPGPFDD